MCPAIYIFYHYLRQKNQKNCKTITEETIKPCVPLKVKNIISLGKYFCFSFTVCKVDFDIIIIEFYEDPINLFPLQIIHQFQMYQSIKST